MQTQTKFKPSPFDLLLSKLQNKVFYEFGGPMLMPIRYQVNFFKGFTLIWAIFLMYYFKNTSTGMHLYLFLHGTYGILWIIKDVWFPDGRAQKSASIGSHLVLFALLAAYWSIPVPLAMGYGISYPSFFRIAALLLLYLSGVILMMGSDYQKYKALQSKKGLISTGFFKLSRNPNYLGELMIYLSFCLCSGHLISFLAFLLPGGILFTLNIYLKQQLSFKVKEGYELYRQQSNIFLPKISKNALLDWLLYLIVLCGLTYFFWLQAPNTFFYPFDSYLFNL